MILRRPARLAVLFALAALCGCSGGKVSLFSAGGTAAQTDDGIRQSVLAYWQHDYPDTPPPTILVSQGVVSLSGTVDTPQMRVDAVRDAWQPLAVSEVVNELKVAQNAGQNAALGTRKDDATTIKLRSRLTFDPDIQSTDYSIETVGGTIYLMGVARDDAELAQVQKMAEGIAGSGKVISYVRPRQAG